MPATKMAADPFPAMTTRAYTMDARDYNVRVMKGFFRKIYPVIAGQIRGRTGVDHGVCVDLGGGPGMLGIEYARLTAAEVEICDPLPGCIEEARTNIVEAGLGHRVTARLGAAETLPYGDASVDLVMSRGSVFFWKDQEKGFGEVQRVLRPGGWAYIGGGFGTPELLAEVLADHALDPKWEENRRQRLARNPPGHFDSLVDRLGLPAKVESCGSGTWVIWRK